MNSDFQCNLILKPIKNTARGVVFFLYKAAILIYYVFVAYANKKRGE